MGIVRSVNLGGVNVKSNPLGNSGELLRAVNVDPYHIGAWKRRPGVITYLGTPDNASVSCMFNFSNNTGTQFWNHRVSGGSVYYSTQGTGAWTICGNGTLGAGAFTSPAVLENTMLIGDGTANTRHTTNGTSFTDTTNAPKAPFFAQYQNRIWAGGTASSTFYSNVGTPTDWTNDSSSINIPGAGKMNQLFKTADRLVSSKNSGGMFRYDGYNLVDLSTNLGPSSPQSLGTIEDYRFFLNRYGIFGYGGAKPQLLSNKIEKQIYNDAGVGVAGTTFNAAPGIAHRYDYFLSVGSIREDLTDEPINNALIIYDYRLNQFRNYSMAVQPTSFLSFQDASGNQQLVFGDGAGQCYQLAGTATTDNGTAITSYIEGFIHGDSFLDKKWNWIRMMFNPGCQAQVQIAITDTFTRQSKSWQTLGQAKDGVVEYRFPGGAQGKFLFYKISDSSKTAPFEWFGAEFDADLIKR